MKMKSKLVFILWLIAILFSVGCSDDKGVVIERFDRAVVSYPEVNLGNCSSIHESYAPVIDLMQKLEGVGCADSLIFRMSTSRAYEVFQPDIEMRLPDLSEVEAGLSCLKENLLLLLPNVTFPSHIYGAVIPYEQSILVADSIVVLGLNHYLGADYEGYGQFDDYRRRLKESNRIVYDVAEALVRVNYPFAADSESTAYSRIVYEGMIVWGIKSLIDGADLASALGYTQEQVRWAEDNEKRVWRKMIQDNVLYSTDPAIALRLVEPSPATSIINPLAPGRIGRYIGYKIVENYFANNSACSLEDLLVGEFYKSQQMLVDAKYK